MRLEGKDRTAEYAELKRRFGWEFNGMRLHEYYFEGLGGTDEPEAVKGLYERLGKEYGSFDAWKKDFISTGMMRGIGWVVLYEEPRTGKLVNAWINEHDVGHLAGAKPILVMDVFEHAFITDYQLDRAAYIEAFFNNIDWQKTSLRLSGE
jgi:Fe-Mn family superoxide dismutase